MCREVSLFTCVSLAFVISPVWGSLNRFVRLRENYGLWTTPEMCKGRCTITVRAQLARSPDKPISVNDERTVEACRNLLHLQLRNRRHWCGVVTVSSIVVSVSKASLSVFTPRPQGPLCCDRNRVEGSRTHALDRVDGHLAGYVLDVGHAINLT